MKKKRVLITGAAGFIGSHLSDLFVKKGYSVVGIDNLITGSVKNIRHLVKKKDFTFVEHDVSKYITVKGKIDYVLHFASPASPIDYLKHPIKTLKVGSLGTHNALGVAKAKRAAFLLASTSEVYGDPLVNPQPEGYWGNVNCIGPRGVYDEAKRFAEAITMAYHRTHGIDTKIARIFNTYGERMRKRDGRVIPNFIDQLLRDEPLTVYGDGRQTRSFCYISDMLSGLYGLLMSDLHEPVNLGNPREITITELADIIQKVTGKKCKIEYKDLPVNDPKVRRPDIELARKKLNWEPCVTLEEGLRTTIKYFDTKNKVKST